MKREAENEINMPTKKHMSESYLDSYNTLESILAKKECADCQRDITKSIQINLCDPPKIVCVECFNKPIYSNVAYIPNTHINFPVISADWNAYEELYLIQGLEKYGVDNWNEIANHISTKTPKDCEEHYYTYYYRSKQDRVFDKQNVISKRNDKTKKIEVE